MSQSPFLSAPLLNSFLIGLSDLALLAVLFRVVRLRSPRIRAGLYALAIGHCLAALFFISPATWIHLRFMLYPDTRHADLLPILRAIDLAAAGLFVTLGTTLLLVYARRSVRLHRMLSAIERIDDTRDGRERDFRNRVRRLAAQLGVRSPTIVVLRTSRVISPFVTGVWHPKLVVSASTFALLTSDELDAVVAHELYHVRHRDVIFHVALRCLSAVLFFHVPLKRLIHGWAEEIEKLRDREVCAHLGGRRRGLASSLLKLHSSAPALSPDGGVAMISGSRKRMERRLHHLTTIGVKPRPLAWLVKVVLFLFVVPIVPSAPPKWNNAVDVRSMRDAPPPSHCGKLVLTLCPNSALLELMSRTSFCPNSVLRKMTSRTRTAQIHRHDDD